MAFSRRSYSSPPPWRERSIAQSAIGRGWQHPRALMQAASLITPPRVAWRRDLPLQGRVNKQSRSRGAFLFAPEFCQQRTNRLPNKSKREAERRKAHQPCPRRTPGCCHPNMLRARMRALRSPLAFRRSTAALVAGRTLTTRPRPRFTRTRGRGRYPRLQSRLSGAPRSPVVMPAGTMPGPPGSGVTSPARGNRTCSINRPSRGQAPSLPAA
jgi:hypothetical protein